MPAQRTKRKSRSRSSQQFTATRRWIRRPESWLVFAADVLIAFLIIGFPFIMGGREAWGHLVLITSSLLLGGIWCLHQVRTGGRLVFTGAEFLALAAVILLWAQTSPVGPEMLDRLSPDYSRFTAAWGTTQPAAADSEAATWNTPSLMPVETQHGLWVLVAYIVVGVVTAQRIRCERDAERILKLVAVSGVTMAAFAAVQFSLSNDRFFWFYRNPFTGTREIVKGAFTNRNHFAQFLCLSLGPLLWWITMERAPKPDRNGLGPAYSSSESLFDKFITAPVLLLICALGCVLLCVMLSLSRGGMVAAGAACVVALLGLARSRQLGASLPMMVLLLGGLTIGGLLVFGSQKVESRVNQLASADADNIDQMSCRRAIWAADFEAIKKFPLLGTGVGSHREVYPAYMENLADFTTFEFTHAESSYIHLALETGITGLVLLGLGLTLFACRIGFALWRSGSGIRRDYLAAVAAALAAGSLHAVADFIWYVPAIVVVTLILCVTGIRTAARFSERRALMLPRPVWLAMAVVCIGSIFYTQPELQRRVAGERYWYQYLTESFDFANQVAASEEASLYDPEQSSNDADTSMVSAVETSNDNHAVAGYGDEDVETDHSAEVRSMQRRIGLLVRSLQANPRQPRAQVRMAALCLKLFDLMQRDAENPMSLVEIRDTARGAGFETAADLRQWLDRAFGKAIRLPLLADRMARRALAYCPVQGPAYLTLLDTGFLNDPADQHLQAQLDQVLALRQYDPRTRYVAGKIALMSNDQEAALSHWEVVFHANREFRESITAILSRAVPAAVLMTRFQPTTTELPEVLAAYRQVDRPREVEQILFEIDRVTTLEEDTVPSEAQIAVLMDGYEAAWSMKLADKAERLLRKAIACDETAYWPRHALGLLLFETERFAEASETFAWCYDQKPGDTQLERLVRDSRRRALRTPVANASFSSQ
jgi:O-antigen ligase